MLGLGNTRMNQLEAENRRLRADLRAQTQRAEAQSRADVTEILRWAGLAAKADSAPAALSGGEQQRVAIARAVVMRPALLVADEPTGNLDVPQARRVLSLLQEMHRMGTTVVVATHAESLVAEYPAPALRLAEGRLVSHG